MLASFPCSCRGGGKYSSPPLHEHGNSILHALVGGQYRAPPLQEPGNETKADASLIPRLLQWRRKVLSSSSA